MSDLYQYDKLDEKAKQFAIDNLNENPSQVNAHVESFRRWVTSMPHLNCPTDSNFLLKFLRVAKFDHKKAEQRLDNFCTVRSSKRGSPEYFNHKNLDDSIVEEFLKSKFVFPIGRTDTGELIFLFVAKSWNPDKVNLIQMTTLLFLGIDLTLQDEKSQIYGVKFLIDIGDVPKKNIDAWNDPKFIKNVMRALQDSFPMRLKGLIYCKESILFDFLISIVLFFLKDKMKERVIRVKNDIQKAVEKNPGLDKILPTEYGGLGGSLSSCADKWNEKIRNYYKNNNPWSNISVDESKRPKETSNYLKEYADYKEDILGTKGTFTKYDAF